MGIFDCDSIDELCPLQHAHGARGRESAYYAVSSSVGTQPANSMSKVAAEKRVDREQQRRRVERRIAR
jgi:hypothetical protein